MKKILFILLASIIILSGCGSKEDNGSSNSVDVLPPTASVDNIAISAADIAQVISQDELGFISLSSSVVTSDGSKPIISSVKVMSENTTAECENIEVNESDMSFSLHSSITGSCVYEYVASDENRTTSTVAHAQVSIIGEEAVPVVGESFTAISKTAALAETVQIQLAGLDGFTLSTSATLLGGGTIDDIDIHSNIITYTAGANDTDVGVHRILYSFEDTDGNVRVGAIDIAVSLDTYNSIPVTENYIGPTIERNVKTVIDICPNNADGSEGWSLGAFSTDCHIYSDDQEDILQLIEVKSFNAQVSVVENSNFNSKQFEFEADHGGVFDVVFVISDHKGGYATGIVRVTVEGTTGLWSSITLPSGAFYSAPLTELQAMEGFKQHQGSYSETIQETDFDIALFDYAGAQQLCLTYGMNLPSKAQLSKLATNYINLGTDIRTEEFWPVGDVYWAKADSEFLQDANTVNLNTNLVTSGVSMYDTNNVTCVAPGILNSLEVITNNAYASPFDSHVLSATVLDSEGLPLQGQSVSFYTKGDEVVYFRTGVSATSSTDSNGKSRVSVLADSEGTYTVFANYLGQILQEQITFIADRLQSLTIHGVNTIEEGESTAYTVTKKYLSGYQVDNTTDGVTWHSSKTGVATINKQTGFLNAKSAGTTTLIATDTETGITGSTNVVVEAAFKPMSIVVKVRHDETRVEQSEGNITLRPGDALTILAAIRYENPATGESFLGDWKSTGSQWGHFTFDKTDGTNFNHKLHINTGFGKISLDKITEVVDNPTVITYKLRSSNTDLPNQNKYFTVNVRP